MKTCVLSLLAGILCSLCGSLRASTPTENLGIRALPAPGKIAIDGKSGDWDLSGGRQLWWHAGMKPGDTLALAFPSLKAGKYRVFGRFLRAPDYGIHQLAINGKKAGAPIDFYTPNVEAGKEMDLGVFDLKESDNEFAATVVGANEKAVKAYMLGLDYLRLEAAQ